MTSEEFIKLFKTPQNGTKLIFGSVDPDYTSGSPKVLIDGDSVLSTKAYPHLASYSPAANDRVALLTSGQYALIIGKIST